MWKGLCCNFQRGGGLEHTIFPCINVHASLSKFWPFSSPRERGEVWGESVYPVPACNARHSHCLPAMAMAFNCSSLERSVCNLWPTQYAHSVWRHFHTKMLWSLFSIHYLTFDIRENWGLGAFYTRFFSFIMPLYLSRTGDHDVIECLYWDIH